MCKKNFRYLYFYLLIFSNLFSEKNLIEILKEYGYSNENNDNNNDKYKNKKTELENFINKLDNKKKLELENEIKKYTNLKEIEYLYDIKKNNTFLTYLFYFEKENEKNINNNEYLSYNNKFTKYIANKASEDDLGIITGLEGIFQGRFKGSYRRLLFIYLDLKETVLINLPKELGNSLENTFFNLLKDDKPATLLSDQFKLFCDKALDKLSKDENLLKNFNNFIKKISNRVLNDEEIKKQLSEFFNIVTKESLIDLFNDNQIRENGSDFLISLLNNKDFEEAGVIFLSNILKNKELMNEASIFIKELCSNTLDDPKMKQNVDKFFNERMNNLSLNLNVILNRLLYFFIGGLLSLKSIYWFMQNFSNLLLLKNKFKTDKKIKNKDKVKKNKKVMVYREIEDRNKKLKLDFILNTFAVCVGLLIIKENIKNNNIVNN